MNYPRIFFVCRGRQSDKQEKSDDIQDFTLTYICQFSLIIDQQQD